MTSPPITDLPVESVLPELRRALAAGPAAVLEAPPGAGKTTLVPLHLLGEPWLAGRRILMLEPRRLARGRLPREWRNYWASRSATRSAMPCGSTAASALTPGSKSSPKGCSPAICSAIRRWSPTAP